MRTRAETAARLIEPVRLTSVSQLLLLGLIWGAGMLAIKAALKDLPPLTLAAIRSGTAGLTLGGYAWLAGERLRPPARGAGLVPLFSVLIGFVVLGAVPSGPLLVGGALIAAGIVLTSRAPGARGTPRAR